MTWRRSPLVERVGYQLARVRAWARRVTARALAVRAAIWLLGLAALLVALPEQLRYGPALPVAAVLALLAAAAPGGGLVTLLELVSIGTVAIALVAAERPPGLPALLLLAALLYGHHTAAALGAQLRTDAVLPLVLLGYWALRAGLVLAGSTVVGLGIAALSDRAETGSATGYLALGVAAPIAIALAAAWLVHRRAS